MKKLLFACFTLLFWATACTSAEAPSSQPDTTATQTLGKLATPQPRELIIAIPEVEAGERLFAQALAADPPILLMAGDLTVAQVAAQQLAIADVRFQAYVRDGETGDPLRSEIMTVRLALPGDLSEEGNISAECDHANCFRVELFSYVFNLTSIAIVNVERNQVLSVLHQANTQPELNTRLTELAKAIAINSPEVAEALGVSMDEARLTMPNVKTALNGSRCERSQHLCVAPTFVVGDRALWAIVDLTDQQLVGIRWTDLGSSGPVAVTERSLQDEVVMANFCEKENFLERGGWQMNYVLTSSDGLAITDVKFGDRQVMNSAKLVDWHVSYSNSDGFGYSDAVGCPMFSSAAVIAFNGPTTEAIEEGGEAVGFALIQDFRNAIWPAGCNYRYEQRYEFYNDGRFRIVAANHGRGCGDNATYRPVMRIDLMASAEGEHDTVSEWDGSGWNDWAQEQWQLQTDDTLYTKEGYQYKISGQDGEGYYLEPGQGQFEDGGKADNAYLFATVHHSDRDEGDSDLITIGPCCNNDHQQGPEKFMDSAEPIADVDLVLWYVPQQHNDDTPGEEYCWADTRIVDGLTVIETWPCFVGPMFIPIEQ